MKKNDIHDLDIIDSGSNFEGIAKLNNMVVFIPDAIIGEKIQAKIIKVNKSYLIGKIENIVVESKYRQENFCEVANKCGGCNAQHISYDLQLIMKNKMVENVLRKQGVKYTNLEKTVGMGMPYYYRNKVSYPVRYDEVEKEAKIGFYLKRSHNIIQNNCCYIQNRVIDMVSKEVFEELISNGFSSYNEKTNKGDIKHIIVRRGYHTKEIMIIIVVNNKELLSDNRFLNISQKLIAKNDNIKSVFLNLNDKNVNKILGDKQIKILGQDYIHDKIGEYSFCISPKSFFQVNTIQAEVLYHILKEKLELTGEEIIFDLYSGVGSIGIFLSDSVKEVYGIEIEEQAVAMANINMEMGGVKNAKYIAGSVEDKIAEFKKSNIKPDVIVVDPPRSGLDSKSIEYILEFNPKKIGYVSCNPATLARDLKLLSVNYDITCVVPVDLFPQTNHVECVVILKYR